MSGVLALAMKDLRLVWRDKLGLFWILGFPILMALIFGSAMGGGGGARGRMKIAVVDEDGTELSKAFVAQLRASSSLDVVGYDPADSKRVRAALAAEANAAGRPAPSVEENLAAVEKGARRLDLKAAREGVRLGDYAACVALSKGFETSLGFMAVEGGGKAIVVGIDPSRQAEGGFLQGIVIQALFESLRTRFLSVDFALESVADGVAEIEADTVLGDAQKKVLLEWMGSLEKFLKEVDPELYLGGLGAPKQEKEEGEKGAADDSPAAGLGLSIEFASIVREQTGKPRGAYDITFPSAILWGLLGCASAFSLSLVIERTRGTYQRLRMAPLGAAQILAGKGLACFIACLGTVCVLLAMGINFFGVRVGNAPGLAMAAVCASFCFVGAMMFVCSLGKTEASVSGAGWALFLVWAMFGGCMLPLFAMPSWMAAVSDFSPVKWGVYALEGAIWRDLTFAEQLVPCGILVGIGAAMFALGWAVVRRSDG